MANDIDRKKFEKSKKHDEIETAGKLVGDGLAEALSFGAGIVASKPSDHAKAISTIIQETLKGDAWLGFEAAVRSYKDNGRIKDEYFKTKQAREGIRILGQVNDNPFETDEDILVAMKKIFVVMASEEISNREDPLPIALLNIAGDLNKEELLILAATFAIAEQQENVAKAGGDSNIDMAEDWIEAISRKTGWGVKELVEIHEATLIQKKLLSPRRLDDGSAVRLKPHYRLTGLGYELCRFINAYEGPD